MDHAYSKKSTWRRNAVLALAAMLLLTLATTAVAGPEDCELAGTWVGSNDAGDHFIIQIVPMSPSRPNQPTSRYSFVSHAVNDPAPGAAATNFVGHATRVGPGAYEITELAFVANEDFTPTGTFLVTGELVTDGCDAFDAVFEAGLYFGRYVNPALEDPDVVFPGPAARYTRLTKIPRLF